MTSGVKEPVGAAALTPAESVHLGYALVDSVAKAIGVRALAIKGPLLAEQGLRDAKDSVDVDVLVDPSGFAALLDRMLELGWVDTEPYDLPTVMPRHSSTLRHPIWACEVDLHHYFPGFLAAPQEVFEALWAKRSSVVIAGHAVACPSPQGSALVAALHYLRDSRNEMAKANLSALVQRVERWPQATRQSMLELGTATGSEATLAPFFEALHLAAPEPRALEGLAEWRLRSETTTTAALAWWVDLRRAPWVEKPGRLRRAVWPRAAEMHLFFADPPQDDRGRRRARLARLRRGLRELPRAIAESRRAERESRS